MRITLDDQSRIAQAIAAAEAATSGEIFCVVSRRVSSYGDVALAWSAAAALILPALLIPFGFEGVWPFGGGWEAAHESGLTVGRALGGYVAVQAAVFAGVLLLSLIPTVRRWMGEHVDDVLGEYDTPHYEREDLGVDQPLEGPAIVLQVDTTTVVPPGWSFVQDAAGNLMLTRNDAA